MARHIRALLISTAVATLTAGSLVPAAAQAPPTLPTGSSGTGATTSTTVAPTTTAAPAPTTTVTPTTAPETRIIQISPPPGDTKVGAPGAAGTTPGAAPGSTTTTPPTTAKAATTPSASTAPAPRLNDGQVDQVLRTMARTGASSTAALVEALKPLQALGMTAQEALAVGMGRFPLLGMANWTDDWLDHRNGPPVHQHMGNDIFAAFDTPVRAPADGVVRYTDGGLGGLGAYVTTSDGTFYYMAHLSGFNKDVPSGSRVKQGQVIGYNGDSGNAGGGAPHVHFEIHPGGGAAVNPKPILDAWLAEAVARVPEVLASFQLASFQPKAEAGAAEDTAGVPQILVATGLTRRFSAAPRPQPERTPQSFNRAVLAPLTPPALAPLLDMGPPGL